MHVSGGLGATFTHIRMVQNLQDCSPYSYRPGRGAERRRVEMVDAGPTRSPFSTIGSEGVSDRLLSICGVAGESIRGML